MTVALLPSSELPRIRSAPPAAETPPCAASFKSPRYRRRGAARRCGWRLVRPRMVAAGAMVERRAPHKRWPKRLRRNAQPRNGRAQVWRRGGAQVWRRRRAQVWRRRRPEIGRGRRTERRKPLRQRAATLAQAQNDQQQCHWVLRLRQAWHLHGLPPFKLSENSK